MKKIVSMFLCISMAIGLACMVAGCGNDEVLKRIDALQAELQTQKDKLDELQAAINEQANRLEELELKTTQGALYTLKEAYNYGYLNIEQLKSIAYYHNGGRKYNETAIPEDYKPIPKIPELLNPSTEYAIRKNFWDIYVYDKSGFLFSDVFISDNELTGDCYYGTYKNCVAVMVWLHKGAYSDVFEDVIVGGIHFVYHDANRILIWTF